MHQYYLVIEALHVIAVIAWMAGMLYLPRLYVYHVDARPGGELDETLKIMERRLLRLIINPAMIISLILGLMLVHITGAWKSEISGYWFHAKSGLLFLMFAFHGFLARYRKVFARGQNKHSRRFYKILNEVPTLLMIGIVFLVIVKPF
jgi:putative membrane protein